MYSFNISNEVESEEWDKNLKKSSYSSFFQTAEYLFSESYSGDKFPIFISVFDHIGNIKGQLGIIIQKTPMIYSTKFLRPLGNIVSVFGRRASWIGGPIIHSNEKESREKILKIIIDGLEKVAKENNVIIIDGYTPPQDTQIDNEYKTQFRNGYYIIEDFITYVTDLSKSEEEIWNLLNKSAKRDITKAQKNNIVVKELDYEDLKDFFNIYKIWSKTKGVEKSVTSMMKEGYWNYYKKGVEKVFLAYEDDKVVSSHRFGCFNGIVYSHSLVNTYSRPGGVSGPFLTWYTLQWAKKNGMKIYDYSGGESPYTNHRNDKLYDKQWNSLLGYKKKWGGQEFPYFHFIRIRKKLSYRIFRLLLKLDWIIRDFKKTRYKERR